MTMRGEHTDDSADPEWRERHRDPSSERDHDYRSDTGPSNTGNGTSGRPTWLDSFPRGAPLPPGMSAMDAISQTMAGVSPAQMMEVLASMQTYILEQPEHAHALLTANPQLGYALFQALLLHQIVDPEILHSVRTTPSMQDTPRPNLAPCVPSTSHENPSPIPAWDSSIHPLPGLQHPQQALSPASQSGYQVQPTSMENPGRSSLTFGGTTDGLDPASTTLDAQRTMLMQMLQLTNEQVRTMPVDVCLFIEQLRRQCAERTLSGN